MCSFKELLISVFIPPFPNCKVIPIERLHCNRRDYILLWCKSATITSCGANVMLQQSDKLNCIYILAVMCWFIAGDLLQQQICEQTCDFQTFIPPPHQENGVKRCTFICLQMLKHCIIIN